MTDLHASGSDFRPGFYLSFGRAMHRLSRAWHRFSIRGTERIPRGPCLFVGNHSGIGISDVLCLLGAFAARYGLSRRCVGMMHVAFLRAPIVGHAARAFGAVYARRDSARDAFRRGWDVACFPGGDLDACRPMHEHRRVEFGPRRGYVRLALETGVPVVPVATIGSHFSYLLLPGGRTVARALGLKRLVRNERLPITVGAVLLVVACALAAAGVAPWWIVAAVALLAAVPSPVRITSEILPPIDVRARTAHVRDPEARVEAAHAIVHGALQDAVARMRHEAPLDVQPDEEAPASRAA